MVRGKSDPNSREISRNDQVKLKTSQKETECFNHLVVVGVDGRQVDCLADEVLQDLYSFISSLLQDLPLLLQTVTVSHTHTQTELLPKHPSVFTDTQHLL